MRKFSNLNNVMVKKSDKNKFGKNLEWKNGKSRAIEEDLRENKTL